ncbi:SMI1/KNR4 family protein [Bacillus sp. SJS]|uniref:SMI1/KNR4 family protein n=1 Tax=Bacillus sp. SJS TaxID=1423321 RepID=UPI0004DD4242|nr:SMI1/KNR4 family protein [Bacillus sp. SJS]KZZ83919.1 1,3-beta-glucan synthase regulator [Bacillus sp. SJS]
MIDFSNIPNLVLNSPGSEFEVYKIERTMSVRLPDVYRQLLIQTNGFSIGGGVAIYGTEDIEERNATWEVSEYAKGYVAVGDDGEGNVFLMLQSKEDNRVICVESGTMNPAHTSEDSVDFAQWIKRGCSKSTISHEAAPETCHIILQTVPANGLKDLIKIKNVLGINISSADLLNGSKSTPFTIAREYPFGKAKKLVEKLGVIGESLIIKK